MTDQEATMLFKEAAAHMVTYGDVDGIACTFAPPELCPRDFEVRGSHCLFGLRYLELSTLGRKCFTACDWTSLYSLSSKVGGVAWLGRLFGGRSTPVLLNRYSTTPPPSLFCIEMASSSLGDTTLTLYLLTTSHPAAHHGHLHLP
jgi:hypothetical protein